MGFYRTVSRAWMQPKYNAAAEVYSRLEKKGPATLGDLAAYFGTSHDTMRKHLLLLRNTGYARPADEGDCWVGNSVWCADA
jgi:predicted ArsR family transcriptional regulator